MARTEPLLTEPLKSENLATLCRNVLIEIGEDPHREGLIDTPKRVAKAIATLTEGYRSNWQEVVGDAIFTSCSSQMIAVREIEFHSLCEHHLLPFFGTVNIAYLPNKKIIGLSKIPRIVKLYSRRLQLQEKLGQEVAEALAEAIDAVGVVCEIKATHLCVRMRGVENGSAEMRTLCARGAFAEDAGLRAEAMGLWRT